MMFFQVIHGKVADPDAVHAALDRWYAELAQSTPGWLGSTAGATADGRVVVVTRFESRDVGRHNLDRPEQVQWWTETAPLFDPQAAFLQSRSAVVDVRGDPDEAGFVQVIVGRGSDLDRAQEVMRQSADDWAELRPEVLGTIMLGHKDSAYTMIVYFTSEAQARDGERRPPTSRLSAQIAELERLDADVPEFFDLNRPWLYSAT